MFLARAGAFSLAVSRSAHVWRLNQRYSVLRVHQQSGRCTTTRVDLDTRDVPEKVESDAGAVFEVFICLNFSCLFGVLGSRTTLRIMVFLLLTMSLVLRV